MALVLATVTGGCTSTPAPAGVVECTNGPEDSGKIQAAVDRSPTDGEVVFAGHCLVTATVELRGGRRYRGRARSTTLTAAPGSNLPAVLASDSWVAGSKATGDPIQLTDLTVDANRAANPRGGDAVIIRSWHSDLEHLSIAHAPRDGLVVTNLARNGTALSGTQVNGTIRDVFVDDSGRDGIHVQDTGSGVTDWNLLDTWVSQSRSDAIRLENSAGWVVERNHVYGVGGSGISADRLYATSIDDNYIEDFATTGIGVSVQGSAASTLEGNKVFQFSGHGETYVSAVGGGNGTGALAVVGNVVRGNGRGTGMSFQRGSGLTVTTSANLVSDVGTPRSTGAGVTVSGGS